MAKHKIQKVWQDTEIVIDKEAIHSSAYVPYEKFDIIIKLFRVQLSLCSLLCSNLLHCGNILSWDLVWGFCLIMLRCLICYFLLLLLGNLLTDFF